MIDYPQVSFSEDHVGEAKRKTKIWFCYSKGRLHLGVVKWWPHWRRYCFFPSQNLLFDQNCLWNIADFIAKRTTEHKESKKKIVADAASSR